MVRTKALTVITPKQIKYGTGVGSVRSWSSERSHYTCEFENGKIQIVTHTILPWVAPHMRSPVVGRGHEDNTDSLFHLAKTCMAQTTLKKILNHFFYIN